MASNTFGSVPGQETSKPGSRLVRYFYLVSLPAIVVILVVAIIGLHVIVRGLVLYKAQRDAICISKTLQNSEMRQFIHLSQDKSQLLSISQDELPEFDRHMRICLAPFDIVKIKVFDTQKRIIYSTDSKIIGRLDSDNVKLTAALSGSPSSEYQRGDNVWDLDDEERKDVGIVETYVPLRDMDGRIMGSFEVYKDVTYDLAMVDRIVIRAGAVLSITVLSVFGMLMFVIRRATHTIRAGAADLAAVNRQLRQEIKDRKYLEKELLNIVEKERNSIGQELHDSLGQQLTGIEFMTGTLEQKLSSKSLPEAPYAANITTLVNQAIDQARNLARGLCPLDLDAGNLKSALEELATTTQARFGLSCALKTDKHVTFEDASVAVNLYRIAQEAITNAIRHGKVKNILIELVLDKDHVILTVKSDGLPFPTVNDNHKGMGLKIMNYRAEVIDGVFEIVTGAKGGTVVICTVPTGKS